MVLDAFGAAGQENPEPGVPHEERNEHAGPPQLPSGNFGFTYRASRETGAHLVHPAARRGRTTQD